MNAINSEPSLGVAGFSARLKTALEFRGFATPESQVAHLTSATGRTPQTVRRWLAGWEPVFHPDWICDLCDSLKVSAGWVLVGEGPNPMQMAVVDNMRAMSEWEQSKFLRYSLRLLNNDAKAIRLSEMFERGQISAHQILSMV